MRKNIGIGIGAATVAIALTTGAGAALATSGAHQHAAGTAAVATVNKHITKAQAARIAKAKVPHSRVIEIESDDLNNRPVWKVKLATPHGRVIVDVDKRTGKATIVRRDSGGHDDAAGAMALGSHRSGSDSARDAREDARDDRREDPRDHGRHDRDDRRGQDLDGAANR
jgi:Rieske Fe-S protein